VVLATGAGATAAFSFGQAAWPALAPLLQHAFSLTLVEVTGLVTAFAIGSALTVLAWGVLADRFGERLIVSGGLACCSLALVAVVASDGYPSLLVSVSVVGMFGASAVAGSGRAIFGWFARSERGLALGIRQTAMPVGAATAAFSLPSLASALGLDAAVLVLAGVTAVAAVCAGVWLREPPPRRAPAAPARPAGRDPRVWRISVASGLLIVGQVGVSALLALYLHDERGWSPTAAAAALGVMHLGGAVARISAGRWSDNRDDRIGPFRSLAAMAGALLIGAALVEQTADALIAPVLVAGGVAAMSWNGLSFTAVAEIAGGLQAGTAMGIQNTVMRGMSIGVPVGLAALAVSVSWSASFLVMGLAALAGRAVLSDLVLDENMRREERVRRAALEQP
jgi:sugar phosphate permease